MVAIGIAMKVVNLLITLKAESISGRTNSTRTLNGIIRFRKNYHKWDGGYM